MYSGLPSTFPQSYLTLSAGYDKGPDTVGSDAVVGRLRRRLDKARSIGDRVAVILLQQRIRNELAR